MACYTGIQPHNVSHRSAIVFWLLVAPAARQAQEGGADAQALGRKHRLGDTSHDQRQPKDQSGALGRDEGAELAGTTSWTIQRTI